MVLKNKIRDLQAKVKYYMERNEELGRKAKEKDENFNRTYRELEEEREKKGYMEKSEDELRNIISKLKMKLAKRKEKFNFIL